MQEHDFVFLCSLTAVDQAATLCVWHLIPENLSWYVSRWKMFHSHRVISCLNAKNLSPSQPKSLRKPIPSWTEHEIISEHALGPTLLRLWLHCCSKANQESYDHTNLSHVIKVQAWPQNSILSYCMFFQTGVGIFTYVNLHPAGSEGSRCGLYRCLGQHGSEGRPRQTTRDLQKLSGMHCCIVPDGWLVDFLGKKTKTKAGDLGDVCMKYGRMKLVI